MPVTSSLPPIAPDDPDRDLNTAARSEQRTGRWVAIAVVAALVVGGGAFAILRNGDDDTVASVDTTEAPPETEATEPPASSAAETTIAETTVPETTVVETTVVETTVPPAGNILDLGLGVSYTIPDGFTSEAVNNGFEITDGTVRFFTQVGARTPGEDPLDVLQQYIDSFDDQWGSANYSQTVISPIDSSGVSPADGYTMFYRVLDADGTGLKGVLDSTRRADGLVYLTDIYLPIDDDTSPGLPDGVFAEFYQSFLDAPANEPEVALSPLSVTRGTSVHPANVVEGVVAIAPPAGWTVDLPGPTRVGFSKPNGQRFQATRLADTTDPLAAQDLAYAELQATLPGATLAGFEPDPDDEQVLSFISRITGTDALGRPVDGRIGVWCDTVDGAVFTAIAYGVTDDPTRSIVEGQYLFTAMQTMVELPR